MKVPLCGDLDFCSVPAAENHQGMKKIKSWLHFLSFTHRSPNALRHGQTASTCIYFYKQNNFLSTLNVSSVAFRDPSTNEVAVTNDSD